MEYKLLGVNTSEFVNIGDYIQALASSQFYPQINGFVQRERLKEYDGDDVKIIMNGWYMHDPTHWPPSNKIKPLFVAFHINQTVKDTLLSDESIKYLKSHEPIGCRDLYTVDLLRSKGVDAYFSGCMTLTLGHKFKSETREPKIYFVDPYVYVSKNITYYLPKIPFLLRKLSKIIKLSKKWYGGITLQGVVKSLLFLQSYRDLFNEIDLMNAEYVSQAGTDNWPETDAELLSLAKDLVEDYAKASLVITSRIHCALPCLGLGTPVLFTISDKIPSHSLCRLNGLIELFNVIEWRKGKLVPLFQQKGKISLMNHPKNKNDWEILAKNLIAKCKSFFNIPT